MRSFLLNLARRGAGLPVAAAAAEPPPPSQTDARQHGDDVIEMDGEMPLERLSQPSSPASPAEPLAAPRAMPPARVGPPPVSGAVIQRFAAPEPPAPPALHKPPAREPARTTGVRGHGPRLQPDVPHRQSPMPVRSSTVPLLDSKPAPPVPEPLLAREAPDRVEIVPRPEIVTGATESREDTLERVHQVLGSKPVLLPGSTESKQQPIVAPPDSRSPSAEPSGSPRLPLIRPAAVESVLPVSLPKAARTAASAAQMPIHVRIGRVEIRETPEPAPPAPPAPATPAPLGFVGYNRIRNYRSWR